MVRSFIFNILFYTTSIVGLIFLCPLLLIGNYFSHRIPRWWSLWVSLLLKMVSRTRYKVEGTIPSSTVIYAIKHQSAWETITLNHILERPVFVLKKELLWIPFFGLYLQKAGMIALDRGGGLNTLKNLIKKAKDRVARHRSVIIFPEGTRSAPGTHNPYKKGIYVLYKNLNVPVVPVALNSGVYWPRRTFMKYPGTIHVKFLPSIPPGLAEDVFMAQLEHAIETESLKLFKKS